jgi:histidinol-phosphate aminotransferase
MKVSKEILNLVPYKPGKPIAETQREYGLTDVIKLASNENPLGPSPKALQAVEKALNDLHRYPDPVFHDLIQTVSQLWKVPKNKVSIGNGSNEIIDILIRIYCEPGDAILSTQAAFVAYSVCAQAARVKSFTVPLKANFQMDLSAMARFLRESPEAKKVKLVFIPNPNNPTGTYVSKTDVETFLSEFGNRDDLLIIFDEAYTEFVRAKDYNPAINYLDKFPNVISIRTLSKAYGLAGLRVGILLAPAEVVEIYNRVRNPFNVNELAQVAAVAALGDVEFVRKSVEITHRGLDHFYSELQKMNIPFVESQANFVMFDTRRDVAKVFEALLRRGVILRPILNYGFKTHLRMSVGLEHENAKAIEALAAVFKEMTPI